MHKAISFGIGRNHRRRRVEHELFDDGDAC